MRLNIANIRYFSNRFFKHYLKSNRNLGFDPTCEKYSSFKWKKKKKWSKSNISTRRESFSRKSIFVHLNSVLFGFNGSRSHDYTH